LLETLAYTLGPAAVVAALFGAWWAIVHRPRKVTERTPAPVKLDPEAGVRLQTERKVAAVVEEFEKFVASLTDSTHNSEVLARFADLDEAARKRLSAECANAIGTVYADADRSKEALLWLDESANRDDTYFRALNQTIAQKTAGATVGPVELPRYPFHYVPWPGLAARTKLKAQILHDLGRHSEVEAVLGAFVESPPMRYVRADLRRLRGNRAEALVDYRAVAAWNPDYKQVQQWIADLTPVAGAAPATSKGESIPGRKGGTGTATAPAKPPPPLANPPARPSLGTNPWEVLGVVQGAPLEQIHAAYLALSRQYHPDRVASLGDKPRAVAEEEMREINRAWTILTRTGGAR
jgi:tetratricopeptide (TPR) repeat protein